MRKPILILSVIMFSVLIANKVFSYDEDLSWGFGNIAWGTELSLLENVMTHNHTLACGSAYYIKDDELVAKDDSVKSIKYHFYKDKFLITPEKETLSKTPKVSVLPKTVKSIAVLDRTKEPGSAGEPLYMDVINAIAETQAEGALPMKSFPKVIGGIDYIHI